jgi:hypothetical protein
MKKTLFVSGVVALIQASLIVVTGAFEIYKSYKYAITPASNGDGDTVFVAPFVLFLVALYFFFFFASSFVSAVFLFRRKYLRICFGLTLLICAEAFFDAWVLCLRHDYFWIWVPAARILVAITILYLLNPYTQREQTA